MDKKDYNVTIKYGVEYRHIGLRATISKDVSDGIKLPD